MRRFFWISAVIAALTITLAAQMPNNGTNKKTLENRETCKEAGGCLCGSPAIDVKNGCECQIEPTSGTGSQHCPADNGGGPGPLHFLWGAIGIVIGSVLTYALMRKRAKTLATFTAMF
jgi:hypothetical protein